MYVLPGRVLRILAALALAAPLAPTQTPATPPTRETLQYAVEWRLVPAGIATLGFTSFPRSSAAGGEVKFHIESAGLVSRLFRVDDDYTSLQSQNSCAQSSFLTAHEGSRSRETRVLFDAANRRATWLEKDFTKNNTITQIVEIPPCVHDILGALFILRNLHLEAGKTVRIPLSDGKKFVQARVDAQIREEIKTPLGTFKTIRYEVFLFDNVLYKRPGHLHIWLTDDDRRLPVQIQVRLQFTIGTITFRLTKDDK
jgi:hypothetical protein